MTDIIEDPNNPGYLVAVLTGWHTVDSARLVWNPDVTDERYTDLLEIARDLCERYAPALAVDAPVPARYREAQVLQARDLHNSAKVSPSAQLDGEGFSIPVFPMSWRVKGLLRPQPRIPVVA